MQRPNKIATTLYSNNYLSGTAKTNLKTAYDDYATKYNAVKTAHDAISTNKYADEGRKTAWNTALTNLQSSTTTLAQRVQEATTFINTAVYNASKNYKTAAEAKTTSKITEILPKSLVCSFASCFRYIHSVFSASR